MSRYYNGGWPAYVSVAEKKRKAEKVLKALQKKGMHCQPVEITGRGIAKSFWGKAWCEQLKSYHDYENRLARGRSYARHGAVVDLQIQAGEVHARVSGSELYRIKITIIPLERSRWEAILNACAGQLDSIIELLQGKFSDAVMKIITHREEGLFPLSSQISFQCSCPDYADMCKHVAATLYGVGARLDLQPDLLFVLRKVDPAELISQVNTLTPAGIAVPDQALADTDLQALFGIEFVTPEKTPGQAVSTSPAPEKPAIAKRSSKLLRASDLIAQGVPRFQIQRWLKSGILKVTERRGVYQRTRRTNAALKTYTGDRK